MVEEELEVVKQGAGQEKAEVKAAQ
jgi:hypothetical protein